MGDEEVVLQEGNILVSTSRVILAGKTYATANLTSVAKRVTPPKRGCALALIVIGALFVLTSLGAFADSVGLGFGVLFWAALFLAIGIFWYSRIQPVYVVVFTSAATETQAMSSKDEALIDRVVVAINEAIVRRG